MIIPFDISASYSGTPVIKRLFYPTDNSVLSGLITNFLSGTDDATKLASWGVTVPVRGFYVVEFSLTVDVAAKIELGVLKSDGTTFVPIYPTYSGETVGGGVVRKLGTNGPIFPDNTGIASSNAGWSTAIRVTGATNPSTVRVAGDISLQTR